MSCLSSMKRMTGLWTEPMTNCWHCNTELIWQCDHDVSDEMDNYSILTDLHCPNCGSDYEVYLPKENDDEND